MKNRWSFYDQHRAFPTLLYSRPRGQLGEVMICHDALTDDGDDDGSLGEFASEWTELSGKSVPQLKVFGDAWKALWKSGVVEMLARFDDSDREVEVERFSVKVCCRELESLGFYDRTLELRGPSEETCPTCEGRGTVQCGS